MFSLEVFEIILGIYCITSIFIINDPLKFAALFIFFRSSCQLAAFKGYVLFGGIPYFLIPGAFLAIAAGVALVKNKTISINNSFGLYLLFVAFALIFSIFSINKINIYTDFTFKVTTPIFIYILVSVGIKTEKDIYTALKYLVYPSIVPLGFGVLQVLLGGGYDFNEDAIVPGDRPVGTVMDPNLYGIYIALLLCSIMPLFLKRKTNLVLFYLGLICFNIIMAQNRGTWIALGISFPITIFIFRRFLQIKYWVAAGLLIIIIGGPIIAARFANLNQTDRYGQSENTLESRTAHHMELLPKFLDNPLFGSGVGSAELEPIERLGLSSVHNDYLRIAVEFGSLSLLVYVAFLILQYQSTLPFRTSKFWHIQFAAHLMQIYFIIISFEQNIISDILSYSVFIYIIAIAHSSSVFLPASNSKQRLDTNSTAAKA